MQHFTLKLFGLFISGITVHDWGTIWATSLIAESENLPTRNSGAAIEHRVHAGPATQLLTECARVAVMEGSLSHGHWWSLLLTEWAPLAVMEGSLSHGHWWSLLPSRADEHGPCPQATTSRDLPTRVSFWTTFPILLRILFVKGGEKSLMIYCLVLMWWILWKRLGVDVCVTLWDCASSEDGAVHIPGQLEASITLRG